jgi:hypothetical protein
MPINRTGKTSTELMIRILICLTLGLFCLTASAEDVGMKGAFVVSVDDHATVYLNGSKIFHCNIGSTRSPEIELKAGDHIVVNLVNDGGPKRFLLLFASTDGNSIASFHADDFKIVTESGLTDFSDDQYRKWTVSAKKHPGNKGLDKQIKNYSDWMWGDVDRSTIACVVTRQMFSLRPK